MVKGEVKSIFLKKYKKSEGIWDNIIYEILILNNIILAVINWIIVVINDTVLVDVESCILYIYTYCFSNKLIIGRFFVEKLWINIVRLVCEYVNKVSHYCDREAKIL